ncbi:MAG: hypothetical protein QM756_10515 [Polyangiaceae bacterium]
MVDELNQLSAEIVDIEGGSVPEFRLEAFRDAMVRVRNVRLTLEGHLPASDEGGAL